MIGGDLLRSSLGAGADTGEAGFGEQAGVAFRRRQQDGGVEQYEGVGHRTGFGMRTLFEAWHQRRRRGEMAAGGFACGDDPCGVDAQAGGIGTRPAYRRFRIAQAILWGDAVAAEHPVITRDGDHATLGEVERLREQLARRPAFPAPTEEEQYRRPTIRGLMLRRREDVGVEFAAVDLAIDLHARPGHFRRIFPAHRRFGEVFGGG